jgi:ribosomal protein L19
MNLVIFRATKLLEELKHEEFEKLKQGRQWDDIHAGDSVQIEKLPYMSAPEPDVFRGVVIAKTKKFSDSAITLLNVRLCYNLFSSN